MPNNIGHILGKIAEILRRHPRVYRGILFGSRALGTARPGSDIDIAVEGNLSYDDILTLYRLYDNLYLPYRVDFVSYESIENQALKDHIDRVGRVIVER